MAAIGNLCRRERLLAHQAATQPGARTTGRNRCGRPCRLGRDRLDRAGQRPLAHLLDALEIEARDAHERAQHAQHLPARPGLAGGTHGTVEALQPALAVDEGAARFGERGDGQQAVGQLHQVGRGVGGERDHRVGLFQGGTGSHGIGDVERGLDAVQQIGATRLRQHLHHVQPGTADDRQCGGQVSAHRVGRLTDDAEVCAGKLGNGLHHLQDGTVLRMLDDGIAEPDGPLFAFGQRRGQRLGSLGGHNFAIRLRHRVARLAGTSHQHLDQVIEPAVRRQHLLSGHRHQPVLGHAVERVDGRAILGSMTNPCRQQRMVLAEERTDDQQRVEGIDLVDGVAQPRHASAAGVDGEVGLTQPEIDVLAAQATHQRATQVQLLQRGGRRKQHADGFGAVLLRDVGQRVRHVVQRGLP